MRADVSSANTCLIVYAVVPLFYLLYQNLLLAAICYTVIPLVIVGMNRLLQPIKKLIGEYAQNRASAMQDAQEAIAQIMTVNTALALVTLRSWRLNPSMALVV